VELCPSETIPALALGMTVVVVVVAEGIWDVVEPLAIGCAEELAAAEELEPSFASASSGLSH